MKKEKLPHQTKIEAFMKEHKADLPEDMIANARTLYLEDARAHNLIWFDHLVDAFLTDCNKIINQKRAA